MVRNFFYVWCQQALISHLSGCPEPRSKDCPLYFSILGPPGPKIDQKWSQMAQKRPKSDFEGSGGPERLERRGTKLERVTGHICWDFQTNWECGGAPNFGPGAPKRAQMAQKRPKSDFEGSGGLERLERRGTKLEQLTGHICWDFQTNWECGGAPNFGPGAPKKGPNGPKTAKI